MLKRKLVVIALLFAVFFAALGFRPATLSQIPAHPAYAVPADPLPMPIAPPPV